MLKASVYSRATNKKIAVEVNSSVGPIESQERKSRKTRKHRTEEVSPQKDFNWSLKAD